MMNLPQGRHFLHLLAAVLAETSLSFTTSRSSLLLLSKAPSISRRFGIASSVHDEQDATYKVTPLLRRDDSTPGTLLIHWKGEDVEGYSMQFRHVEFRGALASVLKKQLLLTDDDIRNHLDSYNYTLSFKNALNYSGTAAMPAAKICSFNNAMQYLHVKKTDGDDGIPRRAIVQATERCSLVHAIYEVVGEAESYANLASVALENNGFVDMTSGRENEKSTWCVRVRHYGEYSDSKKERRFGSRTRSVTMEKEALSALAPLLRTFSGGVNLREPDCKIYVFDGLGDGKKVLARRMASGPQVSIIAPRTRICETNTPLCPIAAFLLCNVAGVQPHFRILDPFAGSCATLLAAAMIETSCQTVGIEIAHNGLVNREAIREDFRTRHLVEPVALIHGDLTDDKVRSQAREAIGNEAFDLIITDPPYGIRESKLKMTPIEELLKSISKDRVSGTPLLKQGGKFVCFLPCQDEEEFADIMPTKEMLKESGLRCELAKEQPLNDALSRWLVSFVCVS